MPALLDNTRAGYNAGPALFNEYCASLAYREPYYSRTARALVTVLLTADTSSAPVSLDR